MRAILLNVVFLSLSVLTYAGDVEDLLTKMKRLYSSAKSMEYNSIYELYKGAKSTTIHSSYNGYVYKSGNKIYQKIKDTEFIYGNDFFLKINHDEKLMVLDKAQKNVNLEIDLETALKQCSEKSVVKKNGYYSIKFVFKRASEVPFSVLYMRVDKTNYHLQQLDIFYSTLQDFSTKKNIQDLEIPHLKIRFKDTNFKPKPKQALLTFDSYLKTQNNILKPVGICSGYDLLDNRI